MLLLPHADDELMGCGGLLNGLRLMKATVRAIYFTDGSRCDQAGKDIVSIRHKEAEEALKFMGMHNLEFLDVADRTLRQNRKFIANKIEYELEKFDYSLIVAPSINDRHPDHRVLGRQTNLLQKRYGIPVLFYEVWGRMRKPNFWFPLEDAFFGTLYQWCRYYQSQFGLEQMLYQKLRYRGGQIGFRFAEAYRLVGMELK